MCWRCCFWRDLCMWRVGEGESLEFRVWSLGIGAWSLTLGLSGRGPRFHQRGEYRMDRAGD
jgi:hypothetical protein